MADKLTPQMHKEHRKRLRERVMKEGIGSLEEARLLELFLFDVLPRIDTYPIAHRLLQRFGDLNGVFAAKEEELLEVEGIGPKSASHLLSAGEIITRTVLKKLACAPLDKEERIFPILLWLLRNEEVDTVLLMCLDKDDMLIGYKVFKPSPFGREYETFVENWTATFDTKGFIIAHTHPENNLIPTQIDYEATKNFVILFDKNGADFKGHYIVSGTEVALIESPW